MKVGKDCQIRKENALKRGNRVWKMKRKVGGESRSERRGRERETKKNQGEQEREREGRREEGGSAVSGSNNERDTLIALQRVSHLLLLLLLHFHSSSSLSPPLQFDWHVQEKKRILLFKTENTREETRARRREAWTTETSQKIDYKDRAHRVFVRKDLSPPLFLLLLLPLHSLPPLEMSERFHFLVHLVTVHVPNCQPENPPLWYETHTTTSHLKGKNTLTTRSSEGFSD